MKDTLVSIIIPVFNKEDFLESSVTSAINTDWATKEVIIVDDCSTDRSYEIAKKLQRKYPEQIKVITTQRNQGPGKTRNVGIDMACGEWIAFLDADDRYMPDIFRQASVFLGRSEIDGVFGTAQMEFDTSNERKLWGQRSLIWPAIDETAPDHVLYKTLLVCKSFWHADTLVVKRGIFEKSGRYKDELRVGEDVDLWLKMLLTANVVPAGTGEPWAKVKRVANSAWRVHEIDDSIRDVLGLVDAYSWGMRNRDKVISSRLGVLRKAIPIKLVQVMVNFRGGGNKGQLALLATRLFFKMPSLLFDRLVLGNLVYGFMGRKLN